ncbi:hypothetical protein QBC46DRAFT_36441 [Diplogelasinospora grovesii]|uniref:Uncharacterized protein n=1 Tax=Diplogelasinospora grovesii TaxID=303347 RepID=A0AAN6S0R4_9PEZI|nr:hypothetical protein QBC46DRAFT_36441 [Diplogelasinospora grovesii]
MDHSEQAAAAGSNYAQEQTREKRGRDAESSQEVKRIRAMMPPPAPRPRTPPAVIYDITEVLPAPRRAHLPTMATTRMQPPSLSSVGQTRPQSRGRHGVWRASETGSPPQRQRSASGRGHDYDMSLSARPGPRSASQPSSKEPLDRTAIWKRIVTVKPGGGFSMVDPLRCHPIHSLGKPTSPVSSAAEPAESEDEAEHESDESESDEAEHESDESEHESDGETESDEAGSEDEDEDAEFETDSEDDPADPADPQPPSTSYGQIHARRDSRSPNLPLRRAASPRPGTTPARANSGGGRTAGDLRAAYQAASRDVFSRP